MCRRTQLKPKENAMDHQEIERQARIAEKRAIDGDTSGLSKQLHELDRLAVVRELKSKAHLLEQAQMEFPSVFPKTKIKF